MPGFASAQRGPFVSAKGPKTILPQRGPKGVPGEAFLPSGGCATCSAQTVLAENPGVKKSFLATLKGRGEESDCTLSTLLSST